MATETQAETAVNEGHSGMPPLLRFDPGVGVWTIVTFVLLLILLKKFAWKPILDSLDARDKAIQGSLDQAARIQAENARLAEEQKRILAEAKAQAGEIVQTARESAGERGAGRKASHPRIGDSGNRSFETSGHRGSQKDHGGFVHRHCGKAYPAKSG